MPSKEHAYLHEMGIQVYEVQDVDKLPGYQPAPIRLPASCKLVFLSSSYPTGEDAELFEKVLQSIELTLDDALHVLPQYANLVFNQNQDWVWFSGCQVDSKIKGKVLHSHDLSCVKADQKLRRALWQQICEKR
ncbi:DNA polymerase III subunit psi [Vibrio hepatarius]|uniref:DNA polymerase III subunit psi n=1 Tax=Vibrio hepatarius TaxID=171383 RepID=UPI001C089741|nr:DNA polymerase III subunit psi [Vibrio hepatarius]MBU2896325.1 DNA polymerase III subunit psi [Vibrio hepatarius]